MEDNKAYLKDLLIEAYKQTYLYTSDGIRALFILNGSAILILSKFFTEKLSRWSLFCFIIGIFTVVIAQLLSGLKQYRYFKKLKKEISEETLESKPKYTKLIYILIVASLGCFIIGVVIFFISNSQCSNP